MLKEIIITFPISYTWSKNEKDVIQKLRTQIEAKHGHERNLLINLTWFGPQFDNDGWQQYLDLLSTGVVFDNLFLLATVDPPMLVPEVLQSIGDSFQCKKIYKMGNFDTQYHFNIFAPIIANTFEKYDEEEIMLRDVKWLYINYNRKPREHRVKFVKKLIETGYDKFGIVTLGKPNVIYDKDPTNTLHLTIGEEILDYVKYGHWYDTSSPDEFGLPHDLLSLHNMTYWNGHFLNIIGASEFNPWDDIFVSESQFKPLIGMRPFVINGNIRTYQWLRNYGFKTFNHYFGVELEDIPEYEVHNSLISVLEFLKNKTNDELLSMYNDMLPDLRHNRERFFEFAAEQERFVDNILC